MKRFNYTAAFNWFTTFPIRWVASLNSSVRRINSRFSPSKSPCSNSRDLTSPLCISKVSNKLTTFFISSTESDTSFNSSICFFRRVGVTGFLTVLVIILISLVRLKNPFFENGCRELKRPPTKKTRTYYTLTGAIRRTPSNTAEGQHTLTVCLNLNYFVSRLLRPEPSIARWLFAVNHFKAIIVMKYTRGRL